MRVKDTPTVLIVDDNRLNIDLLVDILEDQYKLLVALNGPTALELLQDSLPDIILLDIMMPEMDGYEVCTRLKSDERTTKIPIIFITAKSQTEDEAKGLGLGAVDYITKPVNPAIVLARLKTHLALYNQNRELKKMVSLRTQELELSQNKAHEASRAKSAFLANISHELRTPLNHIMGLSSLLLEMDNDPTHQELLTPINEGAVHLTNLFDQLLDLSMLESDALAITFKNFNFLETLDQQIRICTAYAKKRHLEFSVTLQEGLPTLVHGAPLETIQALSNILLNAFRYTEKGTVSLDVRRDPDKYAGTSPDKIMLRFTVTDTGIGISPDKLECIFKSFEIGEQVMTKRLSGSGIGLTISKHLVKKLDGTIWAESTEGHGSQFFISLPFSLPDSSLD
ncbi:response regulator [Pseudodesulfovibrio sp. JC047]|uniref:hybrid sensor histidine kinase/response regulator n=1 Tax=Pseudodesulfovibrio sp. JC047 TaxID=2683199 RepID=UPI0013D446B5|nr:response regulator [Pseudodesulfovibrio sp. JC047]NDV20671.1 response regulator [Pseudodesulfovibrio sp. JC047]